MGFATGFTGGVTLALGVAYLTVLAHEKNRQSQALALRSQSRVLTTLLEPDLPPPNTRAGLAREETSTLVETAKDRWNEEVESAVRWVQRRDWNELRGGMEGAIVRLLGSGLQKSREGIEESEKQTGHRIQDAVERSKAVAKSNISDTAAGIDRAAASTVSGVGRAGAVVKEEGIRIAQSSRANTDKTIDSTKEYLAQVGEKTAERGGAAKAKADRTVADAETSTHEAAQSVRTSGTVEAARGAIRNVFSTGIEKGREAIVKVQTAAGLSPSGQASGQDTSSAIERTLHERYEKPSGLEKTVEETLEERYEPINSRDNTVLRGV